MTIRLFIWFFLIIIPGQCYLHPKPARPPPRQQNHQTTVTLEDPPLRVRHYIVNHGHVKTKITNLLDRELDLGTVQGYADVLSIRLCEDLHLQPLQSVTIDIFLPLNPKKIHLQFSSIGYSSVEKTLTVHNDRGIDHK